MVLEGFRGLGRPGGLHSRPVEPGRGRQDPLAHRRRALVPRLRLEPQRHGAGLFLISIVIPTLNEAANGLHRDALRSQAVTEKLEDPTQIGKTRKEIARINTILRERQTAEAAQATK